MEGIFNRKSGHSETKTPSGYRHSIAQNAFLLSESGDPSQDALEKYWERITKVKVSNSKFTIIVPVHNEEKSLASSAESLFQSLIPKKVEMSINFILNSCVDRSEAVIADFLSTMGEVTIQNVPKEELVYYQDAGLHSTYLEVKRGNNFWRVYKTETIGKANAIKLGSSIALFRDHQILISVDANNYVEPDTLTLMFRSAYSHFITQKDGVVILSATHRKEYREKHGIIERILREHGVFDDANYTPVYGWCMALDAMWVHENIQLVAIEDYAMGVVARSQKRGVVHVDDARIWGYKTNLKDSFSQFRRYIRGILQLLSLRPELITIIMSDHYIMRPLPKRIEAIVKEIKLNPRKIFRCLWKFVYGEVGLMLGKCDYKREPNNQSWAGLSSTK